MVLEIQILIWERHKNVAGVIPVDDPKSPLLIIGSPDIHT
jgi:hypothetical protein